MFLSDIATIPQTFQEGSVGLVRSMAHTGSMGVQDSLSPSRHSWEPFVFFFFNLHILLGLHSYTILTCCPCWSSLLLPIFLLSRGLSPWK